jgi:DNA-binding PadR family transcriptional regulator
MPAANPQLPEPSLTPAMHHILLALLEGELHGYAIMQSVESLSGGAMRMGPGTLYGTIKRLLELRLVEETPARVSGDDERRRYYRLTRTGRDAVRAETARLSRLVRFAGRHARWTNDAEVIA